MLDILKDSIIDSLKLIPFLFITYIIMEYLEHKTSYKSKEKIEKSGKLGPIIGSLLGAFPQCGFSVSATNLYVGRVITLGTLISIYLSTSDEMIPVCLSEQVPIYVIFKILGIKILIGMCVGIVIDFFGSKFISRNEEITNICEKEHCHCEEGIIKSSLKHTFSITVFIFIISLLLNTCIELLGQETISNFILNKPILGPIISGIIGLIPNCAASVIITELYIGGMINAGTMIAGLLVGSGVGLLVLLKINEKKSENIKIIFMLYSIGVISGIILELLGITL